MRTAGIGPAPGSFRWGGEKDGLRNAPRAKALMVKMATQERRSSLGLGTRCSYGSRAGSLRFLKQNRVA